MLNLSINEQKQILGGKRWKAVILDSDGDVIKSKTSSDWRKAEDWAEYQAAHNGRTYYIVEK